MLYIYIIMFYICNMETRKIYNRISILRQERNISRKDLAEKIGVNFQTIGYLEREEYNPSLDLALRISELFELPVDLIFSIKPFKSISQILKERSKEEM
jgi:putative transcriptional regulator